jgi:hypothetical protein
MVPTVAPIYLESKWIKLNGSIFPFYILVVSIRSVHNICIERLWVDVAAGYILKCKNFFRDLGSGCGQQFAPMASTFPISQFN